MLREKEEDMKLMRYYKNSSDYMQLLRFKERDVLTAIYKRQMLGVMFHQEFSIRMNLLSLRGFKRIAEYQFLEENFIMQSIARYWQENGDGTRISENKVDFSQVNILRVENSLPADANRNLITEKVAVEQVQKHFRFWLEWELETYNMLLDLYNYTSKNLLNPTKASVILNLAKTVEDEIKYLNRMVIDINRDSQATYLREDYQTRIHDCYRDKSHALSLDKVMEELGM